MPLRKGVIFYFFLNRKQYLAKLFRYFLVRIFCFIEIDYVNKSVCDTCVNVRSDPGGCPSLKKSGLT